MAAMARILARAFPTCDDQLTTVAILCGLGLFVSLVFVVYGIDLSNELF
jgi:hypothetical protein